jgi:hypothetical protein
VRDTASSQASCGIKAGVRGVGQAVTRRVQFGLALGNRLALALKLGNDALTLGDRLLFVWCLLAHDSSYFPHQLGRP